MRVDGILDVDVSQALPVYWMFVDVVETPHTCVLREVGKFGAEWASDLQAQVNTRLMQVLISKCFAVIHRRVSVPTCVRGAQRVLSFNYLNDTGCRRYSYYVTDYLNATRLQTDLPLQQAAGILRAATHGDQVSIHNHLGLKTQAERTSEASYAYSIA